MNDKPEPREKATAFVSYAREDKTFVLALIEALREHSVEAVGDWLLTPGQSYEAKLREMSMRSHALIFVISPDSIKSEACRNEIALAVETRKQILPVSHRDHGDDNVLDSALRAPQWIFLRDGNDFARGVAELVKGINTDFALMEMHGRLLLAADSWKNNARNRSYLLRKDGLREAESWLAQTSVQPEKLPQPTPLEVEFILAGQRARGRGTRIAIAVVLAVALSLSVLSVVALMQRSRALQQKAAADDRFTRLSVANGARLLEAGDMPGALLWFANPLSIDPQDEAVLRQRIAATEGVYPRLQRLIPHDAAIDDMQMNAAGDRLLTLSGNSIRVWDPRTGGLAWTLPKPEKLTALALSHDGAACAIVSPTATDDDSIREYLATAKAAGMTVPAADTPVARQLLALLTPLFEIRLIDGATGVLRDTAVVALGDNAKIRALADNTFVMAATAGGLGSGANTLLWRPGRTPALKQISEWEYGLLSVSPDGGTILVGHFAGGWAVLNRDGDSIAKGNHVGINVSSEHLSSVALSPTGAQLATADSKGRAVLWDARTANPIGKPLQHGRSNVYGMAFSPGGRWLATISVEPNALTVWDTVSLERLFRHELPKSGGGVAFSPSGRYLLTFSRGEGEARVWDVGSGQAVSPTLAGVFQAQWASDGRTVMTAGADHTVRAWDAFPTATTLSLEQRRLLRTGWFSSDGQSVIAAVGNSLELYPLDWFDRTVSSELHPPALHGGRIAIDSAGSIAVRVGENSSNAFARDGGALPAFEHKDAAGWKYMSYVTAAEVSGDGRTAMAAGGSGGGDPSAGQIIVWDPLTGRARTPVLKHDDFVHTARFSPDGKLIASASQDGTARIWSVADGSLLERLEHRSEVHDLAFDSTGGRVATAASDAGVRIWNTATGELLGSVMRLERPARFVRFSPDDSSLLTIAKPLADGTQAVMRLWNVETHQPQAVPVALGQVNRPAAAFSPDGKLIVAEDDSAVGFRVWSAATMEAITPRLDDASKPAVRFNAPPSSRRRPLLLGRDRHGTPLVIGIGTVPGAPHRVAAWALPSDSRPEDEIAREIELLASRRLDITGALVKLTPEEIKSRWDRVQANQSRMGRDLRDELPAWHRREAEECDASREWFCVVWHVDQLRAQQPSALDAPTHVRKGRALAGMARWADASAEYAQARRLGAAAADTVPHIARLRAANGDPREHQELVAALIGLARASNDSDERADFLRAALAAPLAVSDGDRMAILELVEADHRAARDDGQRMRARRVLALLEYRSGRFAEASAHLQAIEEQKYSEDGDFLPALVDWRLGRRDDAIRRYDEAALVTASRAEPIERFVLRTEASNLIQRP